jgi:3-oxoacyl-[acyl-carrier-protein] synthase II
MVTPVGHTVAESWAAIKAGQSGTARITRYDASNDPVQIAAEVKNWDPTQFLSAKEIRRRDRYQLYTHAAATMALAHSGLEVTDANRDRTSVIVGSSVGGIESFRDQVAMIEELKDLRRVTPFGIPMLIVNSGSSMVSIDIGATGPSYTPTSACATGADCIGHAFDLIRWGRIDQALAGCSDATIIPLGIAAFDRINATSRRNDSPETAMRPFSKDRDGLVFAEGAGVVVLEEYESAKKRGATIYAELAGYASTSDAFHITAPEPEGVGATKAITMAMEVAQVNADDIDYICAHGTATGLNDPMETKAVKRALGERAYSIPMSSTKSMTGHGMGMTAALEAIFSVMAIQDNVAPPTINYCEPDPECDLDYVPNEARDVRIDCAMSNSFGFGGHNASLIFKRLD